MRYTAATHKCTHTYTHIYTQEGDYIGFRLDSDIEIHGSDWPNKLAAGERVDKMGHAGTPSGVISFDYGKAEVRMCMCVFVCVERDMGGEDEMGHAGKSM